VLKLSSKAYNSQQLLSSCTVSTLLWCKNETTRIVEDEAGCPNYLSGVELKNLPCRGCKYCQKAHEAWTKFLLDVDEAVPLTKKKIIYGQQIDVSIAMIRLFGGEVLDDLSQDFNITSGSDIQEDNTKCKNETTIRDDAFFAILHLD
jgi:hypothetical protein